MILPGRRPVGTRRGHGAAAEECGARRAAEEDGGRRRPLRLPEPIAPRGGRLAREIVDARVVDEHGHSSKLGAPRIARAAASSSQKTTVCWSRPTASRLRVSWSAHSTKPEVTCVAITASAAAAHDGAVSRARLVVARRR